MRQYTKEDTNLKRNNQHNDDLYDNILGEPIDPKELKQKNKNTKPTKKKKKIIRKLLLLIAVVVTMLLIYFNHLFSKTQKADISADKTDLGITRNSTFGINNIVLYGLDSEDGIGSRSDTIMIIIIDNLKGKIKLLSIIRDSYVDILGYGMDKINHAYSYGGPQLALQTLNSNFNLDIKYFATVNFESMPKIIDYLGGIELELTAAEADEIPGLEVNPQGSYRLTGSQALAFSRIRKIDSDFERSRRQRDVMSQIIKKLFSQNPLDYPQVMSNIMPLITTNISSYKILELGTTTVLRQTKTTEQARFPLPSLSGEQNINGVYYYVFNIEKNKEIINNYIYNNIPLPEEEN